MRKSELKTIVRECIAEAHGQTLGNMDPAGGGDGFNTRDLDHALADLEKAAKKGLMMTTKGNYASFAVHMIQIERAMAKLRNVLGDD